LVELTDREKKIILIKYIIHGNSPFAETELEIRVQMLQAALKLSGINYEESEMMDLGEAILEIQQNSNDSSLGFLKQHGGMIDKALSMLGKGNDRFSFK
jgi:hypothetical protein